MRPTWWIDKNRLSIHPGWFPRLTTTTCAKKNEIVLTINLEAECQACGQPPSVLVPHYVFKEIGKTIYRRTMKNLRNEKDEIESLRSNKLREEKENNKRESKPIKWISIENSHT